MGKNKVHKHVSPEAYQRINFLYQAGMAVASLNTKSRLPAYYGYLAKQVSKKIVGKLHPNIKRTLCCACSIPLQEETNTLRCKVVSYEARRMRKKIKKNRRRTQELQCERVTGLSENMTVLSLKSKDLNTQQSTMVKPSRIDVRARHSNRISMQCCQCGFIKSYLQNPGHKLWVDSQEHVI